MKVFSGTKSKKQKNKRSNLIYYKENSKGTLLLKIPLKQVHLKEKLFIIRINLLYIKEKEITIRTRLFTYKEKDMTLLLKR